jgi:flagellar motor protein MotB
LAQLIFSFFTNLSRSSANRQLLQKLISSAASQNELKVANKQNLLFTSLSGKLLFQQAAAVPNRTLMVQPN